MSCPLVRETASLAHRALLVMALVRAKAAFAHGDDVAMVLRA